MTGTKSREREVVFNRYYDPATGQFISIDPAVSLSGSPYGYVAGDPINETDPTGLFCFSFNCLANNVHTVVSSKAFKITALVAGAAAIVATGGAAFFAEDAVATGLGTLADLATTSSTVLNGAECIGGSGADRVMSCIGAGTGIAGHAIGSFASSTGSWATQGRTLWELEFGGYDVMSQWALMSGTARGHFAPEHSGAC